MRVIATLFVLKNRKKINSVNQWIELSKTSLQSEIHPQIFVNVCLQTWQNFSCSDFL